MKSGSRGGQSESNGALSPRSRSAAARARLRNKQNEGRPLTGPSSPSKQLTAVGENNREKRIDLKGTGNVPDKWICLVCGRSNDSQSESCQKCDTPRAQALCAIITRRLTSCENCSHRHREGVHCHVYTEDDDYVSLDPLGESPIDGGDNEMDGDEDESVESEGYASETDEHGFKAIKAVSPNEITQGDGDFSQLPLSDVAPMEGVFGPLSGARDDDTDSSSDSDGSSSSEDDSDSSGSSSSSTSSSQRKAISKSTTSPQESNIAKNDNKNDQPLTSRGNNLQPTNKTTQEPNPLFGKLASRRRALPLRTPAFVKRIRYSRCNCTVGVPRDCPKFEPLSRDLVVGPIIELTYDELTDPFARQRYIELMKKRLPHTAASRRADGYSAVVAVLPRIMSFLELGQCWRVPLVSNSWRSGAEQYRPYYDMRSFFPSEYYRPFSGPTTAVQPCADRLYLSGDMRVLNLQRFSATPPMNLMRDAAELSKLVLIDSELHCCSGNGAIRSYAITHSGANMPLVATLWEHTRNITNAASTPPTVGPCDLHGITGHRCYMYTYSEDRSIRMWDIHGKTLVRRILSGQIRHAIYTSGACSDRHMYAGTSDGQIFVFSRTITCERTDVHLCNMPGNRASHCHQITLRLPTTILLPSGNLPAITSMICPREPDRFSDGGVWGVSASGGEWAPDGGEHYMLWAGDQCGRLSGWQVPDSGLGYIPVFNKPVHNGPLTAIVATRQYIASCGEDARIVLHCRRRLVPIRHVDIQSEALRAGFFTNNRILRRLTCMGVETPLDGKEGQIAVGTSYGEVLILPLGITI